MTEKFSYRHFSLIAVLHLLALGGLFYFSWTAFYLFLFFHAFFACFGVVIGYHRYFSHRAFEAKPWFHNFLAVVSTLTMQGGPIFWAASHRVHHLKNEKSGDPHSASRGFFWSHVGWLFYLNPNGYSYLKATAHVPDLRNDKFLYFLEKHCHKINFIILGFAFLVLAVVLKSPDLFFWLFPVRIVTNWHSTWFLNSYAHRAGNKTPNHKYSESLINSYVFQFLQMGDGFHKEHHEHPSSATCTKHWYQLDFSYWVLICLQKIKVIKSLRVHNAS